MTKVVPMDRNLSDDEVGSHWEDVCQSSPSSADEQRARIAKRQQELRGLFAAMVRRAGGADWLTAMLDQRPSYESKISEAIHGNGDRKIQLDWLAPLLEDAGAVKILMAWLSDALGFEPPVRKRVVTPEQLHAAVAEVVSELPESMKQGVRTEAAKRLGVRPEDLKL